MSNGFRNAIQQLPGVIETVIAMIATILVIAAFDPTPGPLILGGVLAMTLSRSKLVDHWRGRIESLIVLPAVALLTAAVAFLFVALPIVGAIAFTAGLFLSIWLRRFGGVWRRIGSLVALPFITLLIAPATLHGHNAALEAALVSLIALVVVVAVRLLGGLLWHREVAAPEQPGPPGQSTLKPIPSTRMAIQMALALAAAFALGFWLFPGHWSWVVLTAYLVQSGNRGRGDVLLKSGLRIVGAAAGTLVALPVIQIHGLEGPPLVALVVAVIAVGLFLRNASYAFWALAMTLALTLLQGGLGGPSVELVPRLLAILLGAACGILAAWFVLPIRSENVLRRRIANLLAVLDARLANNEETPLPIAAVDEVAPPFVALGRIPLVPIRLKQPGEWVALTRTIADNADRAHPDTLPAVRNARRAMKDPESIGPALQALVEKLG